MSRCALGVPRDTSRHRARRTACAVWPASVRVPTVRLARNVRQATSPEPHNQTAMPAQPAGYPTVNSHSVSRALPGARPQTAANVARVLRATIVRCSVAATRALRGMSLASVMAAAHLRAWHLSTPRKKHVSQRDRATAALPGRRRIQKRRSARLARSGTCRRVVTITAKLVQPARSQQATSACCAQKAVRQVVCTWRSAVRRARPVALPTPGTLPAEPVPRVTIRRQPARTAWRASAGLSQISNRRDACAKPITSTPVCIPPCIHQRRQGVFRVMRGHWESSRTG